MIKYQLCCDAGHVFEGWFRSIADFDRQAGDSDLECPSCGATSVHKAIMAPAVATSESRTARVEQMRATVVDAARRARSFVEQNYDYVGEKFSEEARAIHYGEKKERLIYGEASGDDVKSLIEEGIPVAPLPTAARSASDDSPDAAGAPRPKKRAKSTLN